MTGAPSAPGLAPLPSTGRAIAVAVCAAIVFIVLIGLGTWQAERLAWKEELIAAIETRRHAPPLPLGTLLAETTPREALEYRAVSVEGRFDHAGERHFFATWHGRSGFFVYTPLLRPQGDIVFVNRGFVPFDRKEALSRLEGQVEGTVTINGLFRNPLPGKPSSLVPENEPARNIFYWKDLGAMAASAGLPADADVVEGFVDADAAPNPGGLPEGGVTLVDLPNNHLQYAVTWYGLAAALLAVVAGWFWRWRRPQG